MGRYLIRRLIALIPVLIGLSMLTFTVSRVMPTDPARAAAGLWAKPEQIAKIREKYGLDLPLYEQYIRYMSHLVRGDLGMSLQHRKPVTTLLKRYVPATVELALVGLVIVIGIGVPLGVVAAMYQDRLVDHLSRFFGLIGLSFPQFWLGLVVQVIFYRHLRWFPVAGRLSDDVPIPPQVTGMYLIDSLLARDLTTFLDAIHHIAMPALVLALTALAGVMRMQRASMLEVMTREYINVARAKGLKERMVVYRHALKNALIPVLTIIGLMIGGLLGGSFVVETIFAWPGVGRFAVVSIMQADFNPIMGVASMLGVTYVVTNLLIDLAYGFVDPRIRYQ